MHMLNDLFWDGRVAVDAAGVFTTPAGAQLTPDMVKVFEFGAISALGLFPVTSREEMRAFRGNELALIPDGDFTGIWAALMRRLGSIPLYVKLFEAAYPYTRFRDMTFAHASNAMAGFMLDKLVFANSPWDRFIRGDNTALTRAQLVGAHTFMTESCSLCHGGPNFANGFANVAVAQLGPGQGDGPSSHDDFGRERVTGNPADRYRFRMTPLRNVELTAPYGHAGQFVKLRDFVDHYNDSEKKLFNYDASQLEPLLQRTVLSNFAEIMTTRSGLLNGLTFTDAVTDELTTFMLALTDPAARRLGYLVPLRVPSGLPVDR
jgi:cytochrome c peroxidase